MAKKMRVDSTSKSPPSTSGFPKSASDSTKPSRKAAASAGFSSGQVTVRNTCIRRAPMVAEASSRLGEIARSAPSSSRKAIGACARTCASSTPGSP